jgi:AraC family transcriptional regulator
MDSVPFTRLVAPCLNTAYLELTESTYESGLEQSLHAHEPAYITAVIAGAYHERTGRRSRDVARDDLLFHPAGEEHAVRFRAPLTHAFRLQPTPTMREAERLANASLEKAIQQAPQARAIIMRIRHHYRAGGVLAQLSIDGLACDLLASCASTGRSPGAHPGARRARDLIETALANTPPLEALAAQAGCHPVTLARAFRRMFGCSIGSYVRRRRLETAVSLLQHSDLSISAVAARCGFADQAHLTRSLRQRTGHTPGALRTFKTQAAVRS